MTSPKCVRLDEWTPLQKRQWLESFDSILTDCDGVLWHDSNLIPGTVEAINALHSLGKEVYFVTNNGTFTRHEIWQKATAKEYTIDESHIIAPTRSVADYLLQHLAADQQVYVIGSQALSRELHSANIQHFGVGADILTGKLADVLCDIAEAAESQRIGAVVVGFDEHISYCKMTKACNYLSDNEDCLFLATNSDAVHKFPNFNLPGTGAILAAIETCVGRKAILMGKPNPVICRELVSNGRIDPRRALMIGDCYKNDIVFGKNCNFQTLLVGTGRYKWADVEQLIREDNKEYTPDYYIESLGDLQDILRK